MERLSLDRWASPWLRYQHLARYRWVSSFTKGCRALDAACGTGYGARILIRNGTRFVHGVDKSTEAIEDARSKMTDRMRFFVADVTRLPLLDELYDAYISFETLEHVDDDRALLAQAKRVLKPGGLFICSTPNRAVISPGRTFADHPANPYHVREYDLGDFESLLRSYFHSFEFFGQTEFPSSYIDRLNRLGRSFPLLAVRIHQMRKIVGIPWDALERHHPVKLPLPGEPEVLIALCRN